MVFDLLINLLMSRHLIMTWLDVLCVCSEGVILCVCLLLQYLIQSCARGGRRIVSV
jgi:hypothetical protein